MKTKEEEKKQLEIMEKEKKISIEFIKDEK
jgi:hypothetical protein